MNDLKALQRLTVVTILLLGVAFLYATYHAINNIVAEQSRLQQQALTPVYRLVRDELLRPLYIAETFASSVDFTAIMDSSEVDEGAQLRHLAKMQQNLDLVFFVASERARKQFFSTGNSLDLIEGEVWWYFEAMEEDKDFMADLGQVGDVHLFFDVKMYSDDREFLGYVGVGKRIQRFLDSFDSYKARYGYDFLFVNESNEVILSSIPELVVTDADIPTLESLAWFDDESLEQGSLDSVLTQIDDQDFLVSEFLIEELEWRLLLFTPLQARQDRITRSLLTNTLSATLIVVLIVVFSFYFMLSYKRSVEERTEVDALSGLPNRAYLQRRFHKLRKSRTQLCVLIIDLDHFKEINDTYGHATGDLVIQQAAQVLRHGLREMDLVGRWGGEEFVMLLPANSIALGESVAERTRSNLEALRVDAGGQSVAVTASIGVAFGSSEDETLAEMLSRADGALYSAKSSGRNQVRLHSAT